MVHHRMWIVWAGFKTLVRSAGGGAGGGGQGGVAGGALLNAKMNVLNVVFALYTWHKPAFTTGVSIN